MPPHAKLTPQEIEDLKKAGYSVYVVSGQGDDHFTWRHNSGASPDKKKQPPRRTAAQAWRDCDQYHSGDVPGQPEPDWKS